MEDKTPRHAKKSQNGTMSFIDHLDELRIRLGHRKAESDPVPIVESPHFGGIVELLEQARSGLSNDVSDLAKLPSVCLPTHVDGAANETLVKFLGIIINYFNCINEKIKSYTKEIIEFRLCIKFFFKHKYTFIL